MEGWQICFKGFRPLEGELVRSLSRSVNPNIGRVRVIRVCGCRSRYATLQVGKSSKTLTEQIGTVGDDVEPDPVTAALSD